MKCKLCGGKSKLIYHGKIRNGGLGKETTEDVEMFSCENCESIWHEPIIEDLEEYYESAEYRNSLEESSEELEFYKLHDKESLDKFQYTGTTVFRDKRVADVGCGCGAFLDYINGVAKEVIAIEPSEIYRKIMLNKGFTTYAYAEYAKETELENIDVIISFDVIEHVLEPIAFFKDVYELLKKGGQAIIGTPTDAPIMREILGENYERQLLWSTQHLYIFSEKSLKMMAEKVGFEKISVKYFQRYGIGNMLGWIKEKKPKADIVASFITSTLDSVWRSECNNNGLSDYIVLYLEK